MEKSELDKWREDAADAAYLRMEFNRAASDIHKWIAGGRMPKEHLEIWMRLYEAIRDTTAGVKLLGKLPEDFAL